MARSWAAREPRRHRRHRPQNPTASNPAATSQAATAAPTALPRKRRIAQNWLDLSAERGLSSFDQRHRLTVQIQYTTGMGLGGRNVAERLEGHAPQGMDVRQPDHRRQRSAIDSYLSGGRTRHGGHRNHPSGVHGRPALCRSFRPVIESGGVYRAAAGPVGKRGKEFDHGSRAVHLDASMGRTFRLNDRFNLDLRVDSTNALNHVTFTGWNTTINNAQFGLPVAANAMRSLETTLRLRF